MQYGVQSPFAYNEVFPPKGVEAAAASASISEMADVSARAGVPPYQGGPSVFARFTFGFKVARNFVYNFVTFISSIIVLVLCIVLIFLAGFIWNNVHYIVDLVDDFTTRFQELSRMSTVQLVLVIIALVLEIIAAILHLVGQNLSAMESERLGDMLSQEEGDNAPWHVFLRLRSFRDSGGVLAVPAVGVLTADDVYSALRSAEVLV